MDSRARSRLRNWRDSGAPEDQAAAMQEAIRYGKLDPKMVQLAAFLGHPASRLIGEDVKAGGVVIKGHLARNGDIRDLSLGLSYFGRPAVLKINLAMVRMAFATRLVKQSRISRAVVVNNHYYAESSYRSFRAPDLNWILLRTFEMGATGLIEGPGVPVYEWFDWASKATDGDKEAVKALRAFSADPRYSSNGMYWRNRQHCVAVLNLAHEALCAERARPKLLKFCNGIYDDETIIKYMRAEIYPWALGEFNGENLITPEFVAYRPFVPKNT